MPWAPWHGAHVVSRSISSLLSITKLALSDNDLWSALVAVSRDRGSGSETRMILGQGNHARGKVSMRGSLKSVPSVQMIVIVVTDFAMRHEIDSSDLFCTRNYNSLCSAIVGRNTMETYASRRPSKTADATIASSCSLTRNHGAKKGMANTVAPLTIILAHAHKF